MKTIDRILQVITIVFGLGAVVLFFMNMATFVTANGEVSANGALLAFGGKLKFNGSSYDMAKSSDLLFCFLLCAIGFIMSIFSFKSKKLRYAVPALSLVSAIYMLVITLSSPWKFIDTRSYPSMGVTNVSYTSFVLICTVALFLFAIAAIAYLLVDDAIEAAASKDKLTIPKKVIRFFKDYKSEVKKIVWPGFKDVCKNTVIVLIICLVIGVLIWLFDWGLGELLELILSTKS